MIIPKEYKSFKEIDERLNILKLQREIDQESLKLHFYRAKVDLVPSRFLQGLGTTITQSIIDQQVLGEAVEALGLLGGG